MQRVLAIALSIGSSLAWGCADFLGGLKSRSLSLLSVLLLSQSAGLVVLAMVMVARGEGPPAAGFVPYAVAASLAGLVGLSAFYRGLATGSMSVVAPVSATAAVIPVAVGLAGGERPSSVQIAGTVLALVGVILASRESGTGDGGRGGGVATGVGLALVSAVGFGSFFVLIEPASEDDVLWAITGARITTVVALVAALAVLGQRISAGRRDVPALVAVGAFDIVATTLFAAATQEGLLSVVGVAGSLYPVVTIVLARAVLAERIARPQQAGVAGTMTGVALIAAG